MRKSRVSTQLSASVASPAKVAASVEEIVLDHQKIEPIEFRSSKDELNLIEYPWTALWKCEDASTVISHEWEVPHPTIPNKMVRALWRVAGDPELGLPTASDLRVYLVLMELTRDRGLPQIVHFTRWELLNRLGWPDVKQRYDALRLAFRRLKGVTISAENAFRDGRTKALKDVEFSIIDNVEIVAAKAGRKPKSRTQSPNDQNLDLPLSFFRWNDTIYNSLNNGYLATLNLDFALSLRNDVALSLYRLLSKKKYGGRATYEMELSEFYHRHLGLRPTRFASKMKERLKTGHDELIQRGFLHEVLYAPMKTRKAEKIVYVFEAAPISELPKAAEPPVEGPRTPHPAPLPLQTAKEVKESETAFRMRAIHVSEPLIQFLLDSVESSVLTLQLDCLADRKPKDAAATFVSAVRGGWAPPGAFLARQEAQIQRQTSEHTKRQKVAKRRELERIEAEREANEAFQNEELNARFEMLPERLQKEIESKIRERMQLVLQHLGEEAAQNGWAATRRQIMREWDEQGRLDTAQLDLDAEDSPLAHSINAFSSDKEVEALFARLPATNRQMVENEAQQRLEISGLGHLTDQHPGRIGVRRTVLREMMKSGQIILPSDI